MKLFKAETPLEWIIQKANLVPLPLLLGMANAGSNRVFLTALRLGIFEITKNSALTAEEIAQKAGFHPKAVASLMNNLTAFDCFKYRNGRYEQTRMVRKWCMIGDPETAQGVAEFCDTARDKMLGNLEHYLKTGKGIELHESMTDREWSNYQIMMEFMAGLTAASSPRITPIPPNPTAMLDIGGSHGLYCVEMCKKYPSLKATILELPEAVVKARLLLAKRYTGDRIAYWAGNALADDLGQNKYDLIMISSLMHHFTAEENMLISRKAARALKPDGYFVIQDFVKPEKPSSKNLISIYTDLLFNLQSEANTWTKEEMEGFQQQAGLGPSKINTYRGLPGFIQLCAKRPS